MIIIHIIIAILMLKCVATYNVSKTYRLPNDISPALYMIKIKPYINSVPTDKEQFAFEGNVLILFKPKKEGINEIVLHKSEMNITLQKLIKDEADEVEIIDTDFIPSTSLYVLKLKDKLDPKSKYILKMEYEGVLNYETIGFYRTYFINDNGDKIWSASTHFEPHFAREAFPCFDEPHLKAEFQLEIDHEEGLQAVSNTNIFKKTAYGDRIISSFMRTPRMSTYTVAFHISNYTGLSRNELHVLAPPTKDEQHQIFFAFYQIPRILKKLNELFGIEYESLGIGKLHYIHVANKSGAMENWGMITSSEDYMLYDPDHTAILDKIIAFTAIVHELCHMWFGNYVTLDWWDKLWLNEGFATYFEYDVSGMLMPEWQMEKLFLIKEQHSVLKKDEEVYAYALTSFRSEIARPALEFDSIAYEKGGCVIRMFSYVLGIRDFRRAIQSYLSTWGLKTVTPTDLFAEFEHEWKRCDATPQNFFKDWTEQPGYPIVKIKVQKDGRQLNVSQQRYYAEKLNKGLELSYIIPFTYTTQKSPNFSIPDPKRITLMINGTITLQQLEFLSPTDYVIVNIGQIGYYRVHYEDYMLQNIRKALSTSNYGEVSDTNRAHLIDDVMHLANTGFYSYSILFDFLTYLEHEVEYLPWFTALVGFDAFDEAFGEIHVRLKIYLGNLLAKVYKTIRLEPILNENVFDTMKRMLIFKWAHKLDYKDYKERALELFDKFKNNLTKLIDKNIRLQIYCSAVAFANSTANYDFLLNLYRHDSSSWHRKTIIIALGCVRKPVDVKRHFDFLLSDEISITKRYRAIAELARNKKINEQVFQLISDHLLELSDKIVPYGFINISALLEYIARNFRTDKQKKLIQSVLDRYPKHFASILLGMVLELFDERQKELEREEQVIRGLDKFI